MNSSRVDPLRVALAVDARYEEAHRKTVARRQGRPVHLVGDQCSRLAQLGQRDGLKEAVRRVEEHAATVRLRLGFAPAGVGSGTPFHTALEISPLPTP